MQVFDKLCCRLFKRLKRLLLSMHFEPFAQVSCSKKASKRTCTFARSEAGTQIHYAEEDDLDETKSAMQNQIWDGLRTQLWKLPIELALNTT